MLFSGCYYIHQEENTVHNSSSLEIYYQCGLQSTESNALLELTCQIIGDQCFNILRTQEQLGLLSRLSGTVVFLISSIMNLLD